jgi:hypothetical protein
VLPEAFNCGRLYRTGKGHLHAPDSISAGLRTLAAEHGLAFVVSLLGPGSDGAIRNTAYLINEYKSKALCKKTLNDGTGNYRPCEGDCDIENPIRIGNTSVGVLICMDVDDHHRCRTIVRAVEASESMQNIICIPAAMCNHAYFGGGGMGRSIPLQLPPPLNTHTVLANSDPSGPGSFVTDGKGVIVRAVAVEQRWQSKITLFTPTSLPFSTPPNEEPTSN